MEYTKKQIAFYKDNKCSTENCFNLQEKGYIVCISCLHGSPERIPKGVIEELKKKV